MRAESKCAASFLFLLLCFFGGMAQSPDTAKSTFRQMRYPSKWSENWTKRKAIANGGRFLIPALMVVYGGMAIENDGLQKVNADFKSELYIERPHNKVRIDNYLQFSPAVLAFGLDAAGVKSQHNLIDKSALFLLANIFTNATVHSMKKISGQMRPDGSAKNSFPSGHTAEAFVNAEFLRREYSHVSVWIGLSGYAMAAATAYFRMYNNKHWFSDVVAGAGIGIASAKLAYCLYPIIQRKIFKNKHRNAFWMPQYQDKTFSLRMVRRF